MLLFALALEVSATTVPSGIATSTREGVGQVSAVTSPVAAATANPPKIPIEDLARQPDFSQIVISPDGKSVLARINSSGKSRLGIHPLTPDVRTRAVDIPEKNDLLWYRWAGNNRVLMSLGETVVYFGEEAYATRLISLDLTTQRYTLVGKKTQGLEGDDLLHVSPDGQTALLSIQKTVYDFPSVFRVNLADSSMKEVVPQRTDVWEWYADKDGVVRVGLDFRPNGWAMVYRKSEGQPFKKVGKADYDDKGASLELLNFARDSDEGFVLSNKDTGRYALYKYNYVTRSLGEKMFESETNDLSGFSTSDDGRTLRSVWYTEERDKVAWFDPKLKAWQAGIDKAFKGNENWIGSRSADDTAMLVWTGNSNDPGRHYLYLPNERIMALVTPVNDRLKPVDLALTKYVSYPARDGLTVPAYLTLPKGRLEKGLPLIILPHGGPYDVRDTPDYDPEVQLLANRGYAVLQPNFRGSGGYGKSFYEKGEGQWGRAMQDDLDDGMDWLVKQGIADPKRVCMVGSSYGGYAALWGATRNPERYRCAASWAGISDLGRQLKYQLNFAISRRYRKDWRQTVLGQDKFDAKTVSPLYTINSLSVPLLIAHGEDDQTVPFRQSKLYADALAKSGKPHEFLAIPKEGHSFSENANFVKWLSALEAFLAKHNPAD
jgi:dipeptidyl aminopeptidase/acylaminoacyl peptidase